MRSLLQAAALLATLALPARAYVVYKPVKGPDFPRIANCYGSGISAQTSDAELEDLARYDLVIGGIRCNWRDIREVIQVRKKISALKRLNPDIIILEFAASAPYARENARDFPPDGWLLSAGGSRINGWPGTKMINLTRSDVVNWLVDRAVQSRKRRGYDGAFIDCMGPTFDHWACEIATGAAYTVDADGDGAPDDRRRLDEVWAAAKLEITREARRKLGGSGILMANQAGRDAAGYLNGILLEDYTDQVLDHGRIWDDVKEDYLWWCENTAEPVITTIVASSGVEPPFEMWKLPEEEQEKYLEKGRRLTSRMRFGLTTALMGNGYYAYDLHTRARGQHWWYPEYDADLGKPRGDPWYSKDQVWRRRFTGGTVFVNPTIFDVPIRMDHFMRDVTSGKVSKSFIVPAQDGRIYLKDKGPEKKGSIPPPTPMFSWRGRREVIERDGRLLLRNNGPTAIMNPKGVITRLSHAFTIVARDIRPVIVSDDKWKDFDYQDVTFEKQEHGVRFKGEREFRDMRIAFEESVAFEQGILVITWNFRAMTPLRLHAFRVSADLPVHTFRNGAAIEGDNIVVLPSDRSTEPIIRHFTEARFQTEDYRHMVEFHLSELGSVQDERQYGVNAYRLVLPSMSGNIPEGRVWSVSMRVRIGRGRRL